MSLSTRLRKNLSADRMRIVCACAIVLFAAIVAPSSAAATPNWTLRQLQLPQWHLEGGGTEEATLSGVSCPSESLCVAVGGDHTLAFSRAPTGGGAQWHVVNPTAGPTTACGVEEEPPCFERGGDLRAISCPSQSLCVAISYEGFIYASDEPTGAAGAWPPININESGGHGGTHLTDVSCPSPSLCVAVSGGPSSGNTEGKILTSTSPSSGSWQAIQLAGSPDLRGVSCGTPSLCVAVTREGRIFISTDPTGGASAWRKVGTPGGPEDLEGVSCVATSLCAAGNAGGNILTSTNPAGGSATWNEANGGGSIQITGISCPTALRCVAVDNNGDVLTSTDPTGGASSWHFENLVPFGNPPEFQSPGNGLSAASCASVSLCALVGANGRVFTSTEPFAGPTDPPVRHRRHKGPLRPHTIILFAKPFWEITPTRRRHVLARFHFYSPGGSRRFECKRDNGPYRRCHSPLRYWVGHGRHALRIRAIGRTGLRGPAAIKRFRVTPSPAMAHF